MRRFYVYYLEFVRYPLVVFGDTMDEEMIKYCGNNYIEFVRTVMEVRQSELPYPLLTVKYVGINELSVELLETYSENPIYSY